MLRMTFSPTPISPYVPSRRHAFVVAAFIVLLSWVLHLASGKTYLEVFSHLGFIAAVLLVAYTAADHLRPAWLGLAWARIAAVMLAAPVAALLTALVTQGSDVLTYLQQPQVRTAQVAMVLMAMFFGVLLSLAAMGVERKQRERADRLQVELENSRLERELLDVRLRMLHAQIEPHFLFNTLANIEALVAAGSANAAPVLRHLISYLRAAMPRLHDADATLETELQLVRSYLELMRLRMPDRLQFSVSVPPAAATIGFPSIGLLTLVENAVRHGIDPSAEGGEIEVGGRYDESTGAAVVWVSDTGLGMSEMSQVGTGLSNLRVRLKAFYGAGASMDLHEVHPHGLRVELRFQCRGAA
jgi:signal transduction histidine kinase